VEREDRDRRSGSEGDDEPRGAEQKGEEREGRRRQQRCDRRVAGDEERADPDHRHGQRRERRQRESDPARRGHDLAATSEAHEERPPVSNQRGNPGEEPDELASQPEAEQRRDEALRDVEQRDRQAQLEALRAPDVRGPGVAAPDRPDVRSGDDAR